MIDFHNHLMPGVDDGATGDDDAAAGLRAFVAQGTRTLIATPHVDASLTYRAELLGPRLEELDGGWQRLESLAAALPEMQVLRGAEVALDIPDPDLTEPRLRLAGGRFVLVEYPYMTVPPQSSRVLAHMVRSGWIPIVAHPERYHAMTAASPQPAQWREAGAYLQVNAGSLLGRYGEGARANALALLENGLADFMCSDFHARGEPHTARAVQALREAGAAEQAHLMTEVNPRRMLAGEEPTAVPPVRIRLGVAQRVKRWLR